MAAAAIVAFKRVHNRLQRERRRSGSSWRSLLFDECRELVIAWALGGAPSVAYASCPLRKSWPHLPAAAAIQMSMPNDEHERLKEAESGESRWKDLLREKVSGGQREF